MAPHSHLWTMRMRMALTSWERNTALNAVPDGDSNSNKEEDVAVDQAAESASDLESASDEDSSDPDTSLTSSQAATSKRKRNDPTAFATSIAKILSTKLTTTKRADPVLSRSKTASAAHAALADDKLEKAARAQIRAERKQALEKGRVRDVLGLETDGVETGRVVEVERGLKKTAQRGVVKLFNAVRAAQVKGEEARREEGGCGDWEEEGAGGGDE